MRKTQGKRLLAIMLAIAMVLGNFMGGGLTAKAAGIPAIWKVTAAVESVPSTGGDVEVTVAGDSLPETLYYRIRQKTPEGYWTTVVSATPVSGSTETGMTFSVPVLANTESTSQIIKIEVNDSNGMYGWEATNEITVEAASGTVTVDKTALNAAIAEAEKLVESEYTADSWTDLKSALDTAKAVAAKGDATEAEVAEATEALTTAKGNLAPAQTGDATKIKIHVTAKDGTDVTNVAFSIYDVTLAGHSYPVDTVYANAAGDIEYAVEDLQYDGTYEVRVKDAEQYECLPEKITYTVNFDLEIEEIDGAPFTGNETPQFEISKKGGTEPQGDTKTLLINVVDENGNPCDECAFAIADTSFGTPGYDGTAKYPQNGVLKVKASDQYMESGQVRVHSFSKDAYTATPATISFTAEKSVIKTVEGEAYDGIKTYTIQVKKTVVAVKEVTSVVAAKNELTSDGGMVDILVAGKNLTSDLGIVIEENGVPVQLATIPDAISTPEMQAFQVVFPKNEEKTDKVYTIKVAVDATSTEYKSTTVTVAAAEDTPVKPDPGPDEKEGTVTGITVSPAEVPVTGGTVELAVTGTDLTADNWGVEVKAYIKGTDVERDSLKAEVTDITETGATLTIPANNIANEIEYRIVAGAKKDGVITEQANAVVTQAKKEKAVYLYPESVTLTDGHTVVAAFEEEITANADEETLKKLIFIADNGNENANKFELGDKGSVKVEGKKLTVVFDEAVNLSQLSRLYIKEGALRNSNGELAKEIVWSINYGATVNGIELEKDIFDHNGGTAVAALKGIGLSAIPAEKIEAVVFMAENPTATAIPVTVTPGAEPKLTFDVPANDTDKTQCYILRVIVDGVPVYEGTSGNPAEKAVVSVLPKDVDNKEQTLGGLTITGNNKVEAEGELKDITVTALKGTEGALKVLLRLYGTNLDSTKTKVRAIDENGIVWPVYSHVPGCDGEWRFLATAGMNANGVVGDGNSQFIEVLPPKYAGTNKTYTIQVALDGVNYLEDPIVTLTVNNEDIKGESSDYVECNPENYKYVTVRHIDEKTGKELAEADVYTGYAITAVQQFVPEFAAKDIEGYKVVAEPEFGEVDWNWYFIGEGREYTYVYRAEEQQKPDDSKPDDPKPDDQKPDDQKPDDNKKPSENQDGNKKPSTDNNTGNKNNSNVSNSVQTGDPAMVWPFAMAAISSLVTIGTVSRKKKED